RRITRDDRLSQHRDGGFQRYIDSRTAADGFADSTISREAENHDAIARGRERVPPLPICRGPGIGSPNSHGDAGEWRTCLRGHSTEDLDHLAEYAAAHNQVHDQAHPGLTAVVH